MGVTSIEKVYTMIRTFLFAVAILISTVAKGSPPELDQAMASWALMKRPPPYQYALVDLNGDTVPDAVVLLRESPYCGQDGCTMVVFKGLANGYQLVSASAHARAPVLALSDTWHGWHSLAVWVEGFMDPRRQVLMRFSENGYLSNASYASEAKAADLTGAVQLPLE